MIDFEGRNRGCAWRFPPEAAKEFNGRTRCGASATVNPTRTRSTASLPDQVYATTQMSSELPPFFVRVGIVATAGSDQSIIAPLPRIHFAFS